MLTNRDKLQDKLLLVDEIETLESLLKAHEDNPDNIVVIQKPDAHNDRNASMYLDDRSSKAVLKAIRNLVATYKKENAEFEKLVDKLVK